MFFGILSFEVPTYREKISLGIDFSKFFFGCFAGINVCYLELTKNFAGNDFCSQDQSDFAGIKFSVVLRNNFFHDPILWF